MTVDQTVERRVFFDDWAGVSRKVSIRQDYGEIGGNVEVPYLMWTRTDDGRLALTLDNRFGLDLPQMPPEQEEAVVEFIANAIAVGGGYASIYFTDRKMPFR